MWLRVVSDCFNTSGSIQKERRRKLMHNLSHTSMIMLEEKNVGASEVLWDSILFKEETPDTHRLLLDCITNSKKCHGFLHDSFLSHIILSGSSALFWFLECLQSEVQSLIPPTKLFGLESTELLYSYWIGASIHASISAMRHNYITLETYNERQEAIEWCSWALVCRQHSDRTFG